MFINSVFQYGKTVTYSDWEFINKRPTFSRVYYILGGTAYYRDSEREFRFLHDHLYILPADRVYSIWEDKQDKLNHLYFHIMTTPKIEEPIERAPADDPFLSDILALLLRYIPTGDPPAIHRLAEALVLYITESEQKSDRLPERIRDYIDANFRSPLESPQMAHVFGYSPSYLYKAFKRSFGISPKQYYADRRFEFALRCLLNGESVSAVSEALGYSSLPNFSRDFKKRYGLSPLDYRKWVPEEQLPPPHRPTIAGGQGRPHRQTKARRGGSLRARRRNENRKSGVFSVRGKKP